MAASRCQKSFAGRHKDDRINVLFGWICGVFVALTAPASCLLSQPT